MVDLEEFGMIIVLSRLPGEELVVGVKEAYIKMID